MIALERRRATIPARYKAEGLKKALSMLMGAYYDNAGAVPFNQQKNLQPVS